LKNKHTGPLAPGDNEMDNKANICLKANEKLQEQLKKIKLDFDTSVPGGANYSHEEIIQILIETEYNQLKFRNPRLFW
jgi:hypothetical protein